VSELEPSPHPESDRLVRRGDAFLGHGDWRNAISAYRDAIAIVFESPQAWWHWGLALLVAGRHQQAVWKFHEAIERAPRYLPGYLLAGGGLLEAAQHSEALDIYERAAEFAGDHFEVVYGTGRAHQALGDDDAALASYRRASAIDDQASMPHAMVGQLLANRQQWQEAIAELDAAIALEPSTSDNLQPPGTRTLAAFSLLALRRNREAWIRVEEASAQLDDLSATMPPEYLVRPRGFADFVAGMVATELKWYETALERFEAAQRLRDNYLQAGLHAVLVLWRVGRFAAAWRLAEELYESVKAEIVAGEALSSERAEELARICSVLDRSEEAIALLQRVDEPARPPSALAALARAHLERQEEIDEVNVEFVAQAEEAYRRAIHALEADEKDAPRLLATGSLYLAFGDDDRAKPPLLEALTLDPDEAVTYANLGQLHARQGDPGGALNHFRSAVRRDPDFLPYKVGEAEALLALGMLDAAEGEYRWMLDRAPSYVDAHVGLGQVLVSRGDAGDAAKYRAAIDEFTTALNLADTMQGSGRERRASSSLGRSRRAAVLYARGRARILLAETRSGLLDRRRLQSAESDFARAEQLGSHEARLARQRVRERREQLRLGAVGDAAPGILLTLLIVPFAMVQLGFFASIPRALGATEYTALTLGLFVLILGALSIRNLLKIKVAGVELEKAAVEKQTVEPLDIGPRVMPSAARLGFAAYAPNKYKPSPQRRSRTALAAEFTPSSDAFQGGEKLDATPSTDVTSNP
jgi:tetratricopeptide (TPR) repeat protein